MNPTGTDQRQRHIAPSSSLADPGSRIIQMVIMTDPHRVYVPGNLVWRWNGGIMHALLCREHHQSVLVLAWDAAFVERMGVALVVFLLLQSWLVRIVVSVALAVELTRRRPLYRIQ